MTSLTIEMGLRRRTSADDPAIPSQIAARDDVTLAQKQRLAVLAKMGLGPVASPNAVTRRPPALPEASASAAGPPAMDRRAALLEQERRFREQEERQREQEELQEQQERAKKKKGAGGIARLGPVMAREQDILQFLPAPAREPEPPPPPAQREGAKRIEIKVSTETAERAKASSEAAAQEDEEDGEEEGQTALAFLQILKAQKKDDKPKKKIAPQQEDQRQKPSKKKRKKGGDKGAGDDENHGEEDAWEEEDETLDEARQQERDWQREPRGDREPKRTMMVVESVKGKVSHANRNMTDADLERRFSMQDSGRTDALMTEEQVLRMIRKEKERKGPAGSASRRIQRELAEWEATKEQQRARVKSPHRFERMVVARR